MKKCDGRAIRLGAKNKKPVAPPARHEKCHRATRFLKSARLVARVATPRTATPRSPGLKCTEKYLNIPKVHNFEVFLALWIIFWQTIGQCFTKYFNSSKILKVPTLNLWKFLLKSFNSVNFFLHYLSIDVSETFAIFLIQVFGPLVPTKRRV